MAASDVELVDLGSDELDHSSKGLREQQSAWQDMVPEGCQHGAWARDTDKAVGVLNSA